MSHSIIAPSSAGIWGKPDGCRAYPLMAAAYPQEPTEESKEGEAAHEIAQQMINDSRKGFNNHKLRDWLNITMSNGVAVTEEMFEAALLYCDDVVEVMRSADVFGGEYLKIEEYVNCPDIHELSGGTPDCWLFDRKSFKLYVWDFKYGFGFVDEFENYQAINYVSGIFSQLNINGVTDQMITVSIRIVQPRCYQASGPIREWTVTASDLRGYFNHLRQGAEESLSGVHPARTGDHCKYCEARHACPAALKAGLQLYEVAAQPMPHELDPEALGLQLAIVKRAVRALELLETGYEEQVKSLVKSGSIVPHFELEPTMGRETWSRPFDEVINLGKLMEVDLRKEALKTPKQAIKLGIDDSVIKAYTEQRQTGTKLVPSKNQARKVFSK